MIKAFYCTSAIYRQQSTINIAQFQAGECIAQVSVLRRAAIAFKVNEKSQGKCRKSMQGVRVQLS